MERQSSARSLQFLGDDFDVMSFDVTKDNAPNFQQYLEAYEKRLVEAKQRLGDRFPDELPGDLAAMKANV